MLSAAEDIMDQQNHKEKVNTTDVCYEKITKSRCSQKSTGAVLLADIIPCIFVQLIFLFFMQNIAYGIRHALIIFCQISSFFIVAFSPNITISLTGTFH
uniref:Uncharacterized protein n=1 Tax=Panagrolaimus sp. PS1159 TaxID=55785 RepID=A0AC35FN97_9BILA